jgi:hypothetical protein
MVTQLISHELIETTHPKAKELSRYADYCVSLAKDVRSFPPSAPRGERTSPEGPTCMHACMHVVTATSGTTDEELKSKAAYTYFASKI